MFPLPPIVGTEVPDMTFRVAACVTPAAEIVVLDVQNDLGAGNSSSGAVCICIADEKIATLCLGTTNLIGLLHVSVERAILDRYEREHCTTERQLSEVHHPRFACGDKVLLEPECGA